MDETRKKNWVKRGRLFGLGLLVVGSMGVAGCYYYPSGYGYGGYGYKGGGSYCAPTYYGGSGGYYRSAGYYGGGYRGGYYGGGGYRGGYHGRGGYRALVAPLLHPSV
ncbi:MAG: hypothetical protein AAF591_21115, partial [Verrucomicrobiota bacterium]